jgi:hypothetical protein
MAATAMVGSHEQGAATQSRTRTAQSGLGLNAVRAGSLLRRSEDPPAFTVQQRAEFLRTLEGIVEAAAATRRPVPEDTRRVNAEKPRARATVEGVRIVVDGIRRAQSTRSTQNEEETLRLLVLDLVNLVEGNAAEHPDALLAYLDSIAAAATMQRPSPGDVVVRGRRGASRVGR